MHSEQRGHHGTAADVSGRPLQHPEQQHHVQGVQKQIYIMVTSSIEVKELNVRSMREPGEGMPIGRRESRKRPRQGSPVQTGPDVKVVEDIICIIVVRERLAADREVQYDGRNRQQQTESEYLTTS